MSVLVKDMEMPGSCYQCNMCVNVLYGEDIVVICTALEKEIIALMAERQDDCPLVEVPSADVQPVVHGEWVDGGVDGVGACDIEYRYNKCSVCGYKYSFPIKYNFCPNCGADMRPDGGA